MSLFEKFVQRMFSRMFGIINQPSKEISLSFVCCSRIESWPFLVEISNSFCCSVLAIKNPLKTRYKPLNRICIDYTYKTTTSTIKHFSFHFQFYFFVFLQNHPTFCLRFKKFRVYNTHIKLCSNAIKF